MQTTISTSVDIEYVELLKAEAFSKKWTISQLLREMIKEKYKDNVEKEN